MVRGACGFGLVLLLAACQSDLTLLEREMLLFKAENEELRAEDLELEYARQKAKADRLSAEVLAVAKQREVLYAQYDRTRSEIAALNTRRTEGGRELTALKKQVGKLRAELAAERKTQERLTRELSDLQAKTRALAEKKPGTKASG